MISMIISKRIEFDEKEFAMSDPLSRKLIIDFYLKRFNIKLINNPDDFGVDLICPDSDLQVEVEHRRVWKGKFPYTTSNIPNRKGHWFLNGNVDYCILSLTFDMCAIITNKNLRKYINEKYSEEVINYRIGGDGTGEKFFKVPTKEFKFYVL